MPELDLLATGEGDYRLHDPDALRAWMRDRKRRDFVDRMATAAEAVNAREFEILREEIDAARAVIGRTARS
jgi:hypothetical protein